MTSSYFYLTLKWWQVILSSQSRVNKHNINKVGKIYVIKIDSSAWHKWFGKNMDFL